MSSQRTTPNNVRIKVDVGGYRDLRREALEAFATALDVWQSVLILNARREFNEERVVLGRAWQEFAAGSDSGALHHAWVLATWLQENVTRPVVPG